MPGAFNDLPFAAQRSPKGKGTVLLKIAMREPLTAHLI